MMRNLQAAMNADLVFTLEGVGSFAAATAAIRQGEQVVQTAQVSAIGGGDAVVTFPRAGLATLREGGAEWDLVVRRSGGGIDRPWWGTVSVVAGSATAPPEAP